MRDNEALQSAFKRWQAEGRVHPWTCREDGCRALLDMEIVGNAVTLRCYACGFVQYLYDTHVKMIEDYGDHVWDCLSCDKPLADGEWMLCVECGGPKPEPRCERCGHYASICGHSLPFLERIKTVNIDRTSLR